jgi:hypothetical protein
MNTILTKARKVVKRMSVWYPDKEENRRSDSEKRANAKAKADVDFKSDVDVDTDNELENN